MPRPASRLLVLALFLAAGPAARAQVFYPPTGGGGGAGGGYLPPPSAGGGYIPPAGIDTRVGDLRGYFDQAFGHVPAVQAPSVIYSATLGASETYDTNAVVSDKGTHDFITQVTPGFGVIADTARITGSLFYDPTLVLYAYHGNQNYVAQNLNAASTAIIIPDWVFLDVRGYVANQSITGYYGLSAQQAGGRSNSVLTSSYSVAPTLRHAFGGTAVVQLGYSASYTSYGGYNNAATQAGLNQNSITQTEVASVSTGPDFGRFNNTLALNGSQSTGSGNLTTSHDNTIQDTVTYAVDYNLFVNASIGRENTEYTGSNYNINDTIWSVGGHWAPNPDSSIDASYGRNQGQNSLTLNATYAAAPHTVVFASYNQSVGTNLSNLQRAVSNTTVGPSGVTFLNNTNTPVLLTNNFAGLYPGLFRTTTASISGAVTHPRDTYTVTISHSNSSQLATGVTGSTADNSSTSTFGTASWGHDLAEDLHSNLLAQYGINSGSGVANQGFGNNQNSYLFTASVTYSVSTTLSVSGSLTQTDAPSGINGHVGSREIAIISLQKTIY